MKRFALILLASLSFLPALGIAEGPTRGSCGPNDLHPALRRLIPQGVAGADFQSACSNHDRCWEVPGADRAACDRAFLRDMQCACCNSKAPLRCRITARIMVAATKRFGNKWFVRAQQKALASQ